MPGVVTVASSGTIMNWSIQHYCCLFLYCGSTSCCSTAVSRSSSGCESGSPSSTDSLVLEFFVNIHSIEIDAIETCFQNGIQQREDNVPPLGVPVLNGIVAFPIWILV